MAYLTRSVHNTTLMNLDDNRKSRPVRQRVVSASGFVYGVLVAPAILHASLRERLNKVDCNRWALGVRAVQRFYLAPPIQPPAASAFLPRCGAVRTHYAAVIPGSFLRARNRFTSAHVANSRFAFFAIPR